MTIKPIGMIAGACLLAACATDRGAAVSSYAAQADTGTEYETDISGPANAAGVTCWKEQRPGSRLLTTRCATLEQRQADADAAQELTDRMKRQQTRSVRGRY